MTPESKAAMEKMLDYRSHFDRESRLCLELGWLAAAEFYEGRYPQPEEKASVRKVEIYAERPKRRRGIKAIGFNLIGDWEPEIGERIVFSEPPPAQEHEVREIIQVASDWLKFEHACIAKDGPYISSNIPDLMERMHKALAAYDAKKGMG